MTGTVRAASGLWSALTVKVKMMVKDGVSAGVRVSASVRVKVRVRVRCVSVRVTGGGDYFIPLNTRFPVAGLTR